MRIPDIFRWQVRRGDMVLSKHLTRAGAMRRMAKIKRTIQESLDQIPDTPKAERIRSNIESMADRVIIERTEKNERIQYQGDR